MRGSSRYRKYVERERWLVLDYSDSNLKDRFEYNYWV